MFDSPKKYLTKNYMSKKYMPDVNMAYGGSRKEKKDNYIIDYLCSVSR